MTVTQFASVNPDALTIAGAMLFFALVLRLRGSTRVAANLEAVALVAAGAVLLNVKPGYGLLALLALLIPAAVWGGGRRRGLWVALIVAATLGLTLVNQALAPRSTTEAVKALYGPATLVDVAAQTDLVLHDPGIFVRALRAAAGTLSLGLAANMVGILGRGFIPLSQAAVLLVLAAFVATLVATRGGLRRWGGGRRPRGRGLWGDGGGPRPSHVHRVD